MCILIFNSFFDFVKRNRNIKQLPQNVQRKCPNNKRYMRRTQELQRQRLAAASTLEFSDISGNGRHLSAASKPYVIVTPNTPETSSRHVQKSGKRLHATKSEIERSSIPTGNDSFECSGAMNPSFLFDEVYAQQAETRHLDMATERGVTIDQIHKQKSSPKIRTSSPAPRIRKSESLNAQICDDGERIRNSFRNSGRSMTIKADVNIQPKETELGDQTGGTLTHTVIDGGIMTSEL